MRSGYSERVQTDAVCLFRNRLITLREITMMQMMDAITDKPEWDRSVVTIPPVS